MPQVAARITSDQEKWLKDYFRTKSAGAEFILPWVVDTFFQAISIIKHTFSDSELALIISAHKNLRIQPENSSKEYLQLRVANACNTKQLHNIYGLSRDTLEAKLTKLTNTDAAALMVWAAAFWVSKNCSADNISEYIRHY
ncbi:hypothetical protein [Halodesulfovibrio spirochaetisodalis]|uniref:Uncharacterized protein n=1 Tax=Halodesulfovibrio spirochaetisodalis TaxID=1560234 RepID=A0A1B7X9U6_9BACT|nr:hypothetical protein [Halodesulfovibrio spirochaetisodalis]OBQ46141.1 hypothetical protein SP90_14070 [Halodesulfovibrio spirochaetisodalis]